jgi:riboflavin kinase/FMN adenylyltransferase
MELIRGLHNLQPRHRGCVGTIGAFDGVHLGHQELMTRLVAKGKELNLPTTVICFEPLPREYFAPAEAPARLMSFKEKFVALRKLGIDRVLRIRFDARFRSMTAEDFIQHVFVDGLNVKYIVVGDDLRFGQGRKGDANVLRAAGVKQGFEVVDTGSVLEDGKRISSTRIRQCLENADFYEAAQLLGQPYTVSGKVVYGRQVGRSIGIPTANMELHRFRAALSGVYAVEVSGFDDNTYHGMANVGTRPTIGDRVKAILEVHLLDYSGNLYGKTIDVVFRYRIRDEMKFESLEELKRTIHADIEHGREYFNNQASAQAITQ